MVEKKKFVLYDYLVFFWRKKIFFLIIPLIFTLLGFGASYLVKDGKYVGQATIFVGGVKQKSLTDPDIIVAKFGQDVNGKIDAYVSSDSHVKLKIYDDNKEQLEKDLEKMVSGVEKSLLDTYDLRLNSTNDSLDKTETKLGELSDVLKVMVDSLENRNLPIDETNELARVIEWTQMEIADTEAKISRLTNDINFYEKPYVTPIGITEVDTYKTELSIAGLILGVVATVLILMLWKYIIEARRYSNHD